MLTQLPSSEKSGRNLRREHRLWHDGDLRTPSVGCSVCPDKQLCGGLRVDASVFNCLSFCCQNPGDCDVVCRNNPEGFARRVREVDGFAFDNVPRTEEIASPRLPSVIPLIYHGKKRELPFQAAAVCLPLYSVIDRENGEPRYSTKKELASAFRVTSSAQLVLSGVANDRPLERWWSLGDKRRERIRALRRLGVALVTAPNFSLFVDQPRWDDLHSLKRIAIVHAEFLSEGLPAALHLNARTERDWDRWIDYVGARPEVTHVAFEFATGAGWAPRHAWHVEKLAKLAEKIKRPMHLVVRGGLKLLPALSKEFTEITFVETSVFMKTKSRQRATFSSSDGLHWRPSPTKKGASLDSLLCHNWKAVYAAHLPILTQRSLDLRPCG
jgi:hypothetical protein